MRFNTSSSLLCCGSKNGTVHVFDVNAVVDPSNSVSLAANRAAAVANASTTSTAKAAAHSLFSGLMETLPTAISSHRSVCSVSVDASVAFICGFVGVKGVGNERGGGNSDESDESDESNKDCIVVVTSAGIVSIHSMNFVEGTTALEQQDFLVENENQQESTMAATK